MKDITASRQKPTSSNSLQPNTNRTTFHTQSTLLDDHVNCDGIHLPPVTFGNFHENAATFGIAKYLNRTKHNTEALLLAIALRNHIERTREGKSERWLLPDVMKFIESIRFELQAMR